MWSFIWDCISLNTIMYFLFFFTNGYKYFWTDLNLKKKIMIMVSMLFQSICVELFGNQKGSKILMETTGTIWVVQKASFKFTFFLGVVESVFFFQVDLMHSGYLALLWNSTFPGTYHAGYQSRAKSFPLEKSVPFLAVLPFGISLFCYVYWSCELWFVVEKDLRLFS